jgi:hypothetical protein
MRTFHHASTRVVLTTALLLGLSACGGGDDEVVLTPAADVPTSATSTSEAYTNFVDASTQTPSESAEPLDVSGVEPPTSETDEPALLV